MRALYLCYFGLTEPLVNTQVIPYLRELTSKGHEIHLLTFEPQSSPLHNATIRTEWKQRMDGYGIIWHRSNFHNGNGLIKLADVLAGTFHALQLIYAHKIDVLHARSHMAMAMAMLAKIFSNTKTIFDIRGLQAEEYVDAGVWSEGSLGFRVVKWLERIGTRQANRIVVLTERMRPYLNQQYGIAAGKITVIPCCVDTVQYAETAKHIQQSERFTVIYAGSVSGLYLLAEMGEFVAALRKLRPDAFFHVLTTSPAVPATEILLHAGLPQDNFLIERVPPENVAKHATRAHIGISFRKANFSQIAASPTKIPEYLAAGIPVVSNAGIGDMDEIIEGSRVGVLIRDLSPQGFQKAATEMLNLLNDADLRARCQSTAKNRFDLHAIGGARYAEVYEQLNCNSL